MARVSMGYPVEAAEIAMLDTHTRRQPARRPGAGRRRRRDPQADRHRRRRCTSPTAVQRYAVAIATATRSSPGADARRLPARHPAPGPRGQGVRRRSSGRDYVVPDDVQRPRRAGARRTAAHHRRGVDGRPRRPRPPLRQIVAGGADARGPARRLTRDADPETRPAMREALSGLTIRGRAFLAAGVTALVVRAGARPRRAAPGRRRCWSLLPLVDRVLPGPQPLPARAGAVARPRPRCTRRPAGHGSSSTSATTAGCRPGVLLLEDQVPYVLGTRPRFVVDRMGPGWRAHGRATRCAPTCAAATEVGPMRVRLSDPFGLVELDRTFQHHLDAGGDARASCRCRRCRCRASGPAPATTGRGPSPAGSAEDVTVREYRRGDDLRRVHWRSSAHAGELMVRREEQPWQSRATLFVDNRALRAPRQRARVLASSTRCRSPPRSPCTWCSAGFSVRLVTARGEERGGDLARARRAMAAEPAPLLESLAVLTESDHDADRRPVAHRVAATPAC